MKHLDAYEKLIVVFQAVYSYFVLFVIQVTTIANLNMICSFMPIKHVMMNVNGGRIRLDTCLGWHIFFKQLHSGIT